MRTAVYALTPEHVWTEGFCNVIFLNLFYCLGTDSRPSASERTDMKFDKCVTRPQM